MRWERRIAVVVFGLILLLAVRSIFHSPSQENGVLLTALDVEKPFYPVYFASPEGDELVPEFRQGEGDIEERLAQLIEGPISTDLVPVLPRDVRVLGFQVVNNVLFINFSSQFVTNHPGGSTGEIITVYAIVNTLVEVPGINQVQILVENRPIHTLAGHLNLLGPLSKDQTLLGGSII